MSIILVLFPPNHRITPFCQLDFVPGFISIYFFNAHCVRAIKPDNTHHIFRVCDALLNGIYNT